MRVNIVLMLVLLGMLLLVVVTGIQGALAEDKCGMQPCAHVSGVAVGGAVYGQS